MGGGGDGSGLGGSHLSRNMQGGARDGPGGKSLLSDSRKVERLVG